MKILSPANYLVRNAKLRAQPVTDHRSRMRAYRGTPPVGYAEELYPLKKEDHLMANWKTSCKASTEDGARKYEKTMQCLYYCNGPQDKRNRLKFLKQSTVYYPCLLKVAAILNELDQKLCLI